MLRKKVMRKGNISFRIEPKGGENVSAIYKSIEKSIRGFQESEFLAQKNLFRGSIWEYLSSYRENMRQLEDQIYHIKSSQKVTPRVKGDDAKPIDKNTVIKERGLLRLVQDMRKGVQLLKNADKGGKSIEEVLEEFMVLFTEYKSVLEKNLEKI